MKQILTFITILFITIHLNAQFTATGTYKAYHKTYPGIDYLFVFDGINSQTAIVYNGASTQALKWYFFDNQTTPIVLQNPNENFNIEDATGYLVNIDGVMTSIWVIDYRKYLAEISSLSVDGIANEQCNELILNVTSNIAALQYKTSTGTVKKLDRIFNLKYNTKEWVVKEWTDKEITAEYFSPLSKLSVTQLPLCNTKFELSGDNFATDLGLTLAKAETTVYNAVKTACNITSKATTRAELNEADRPENADATTASAPLELLFSSNANVPVAEFYEWQIYKDKSLLFTRNDQDLRFKFTEAGNYTVKLTVNNTYNCQDSGSVAIKIVESQIEVPRVFTPNGDGINDEFRVAYKSIVEFKCWVFNRWQQKVFFWIDPQKGWDGKINGKPASEGAYFYIIEAVGADGEVYKRKGNINLLRGKQN